jgi:hypothetical protein
VIGNDDDESADLRQRRTMMSEAKRHDLLGRPFGELIFTAPERMSLGFRLRIAGVRVPGKTCFACTGPCESLAQLGVIVSRYDPDGGTTSAFACSPCAQGPRTILIEAFSRKNAFNRKEYVRLSPSEVAQAEDRVLARTKAKTETRQ